MTPLGAWLTADHREMEALLDRADGSAGGGFHRIAFETLRERLLRHIAIEEKVLFAAVRRARDGVPLPRFGRLRVEHAALTSLLVPTPDLAIARGLRLLLEPHDAEEEGPGGVYQECEAVLGDRWVEVLEQARAYPPVKVAAHVDGRAVVRTAGQALRRAEAR